MEFIFSFSLSLFSLQAKNNKWKTVEKESEWFTHPYAYTLLQTLYPFQLLHSKWYVVIIDCFFFYYFFVFHSFQFFGKFNAMLLCSFYFRTLSHWFWNCSNCDFQQQTMQISNINYNVAIFYVWMPFHVRIYIFRKKAKKKRRRHAHPK